MTVHTCRTSHALGQPYLPVRASGTCARVSRHAAAVRAAARQFPTRGGSAGAVQKSKSVCASTPWPPFFSGIHYPKRGADHVG